MWDLAWYWYVLLYSIGCPITSFIVFCFMKPPLSDEEFGFGGLYGLLYPLTFVFFIVWFAPKLLTTKFLNWREKRSERLEKERKEKEEREAKEKKMREEHLVDGESDNFRSRPKKNIRCVGDY